jgi:hypothetical protein
MQESIYLWLFTRLPPARRLVDGAALTTLAKDIVQRGVKDRSVRRRARELGIGPSHLRVMCRHLGLRPAVNLNRRNLHHG